MVAIRARGPSRLAVRRLRSMYCATLALRSTKTAIRAPRDRASMPAAPLPAKRSRNAPSRMPGSGIANRLCLTRSPRVACPDLGHQAASPCDACDHPARTAADARSGRSFSAIQSRLRGAGRLGLRDAGEPAPGHLVREAVVAGPEVAAVLVEHRLAAARAFTARSR